ncbi:MAG TPA: ABC transporter ATP-binding protein [Caldisericia bacterium]|nr:ABC transporter ATP-binding protein [Caldisericia bacterium]
MAVSPVAVAVAVEVLAEALASEKVLNTIDQQSLFYLDQVRYKHILSIPELSVPTGRITCILGPSGSGKTTFLRLLNKMISPDSGNIYYQSEDIKQIKSVFLRRRVCLLSQEPRIFEGNVRDNLLQGIRFHQKPFPSDEVLKTTLHQVKLGKGLEEDCVRFSGGEKQRLALARILLLKPEVFLLDEPSSSLDDATEELIIERVTQEARNAQKSLIMVTHSSLIAQKYGEYIIHFSEEQSPSISGAKHG